MSSVHDVAVIGAGPAGATAAALLARRGLDVLLLERGRFPRDKLCGEFVSPDTLAVLRTLGLSDAPPVRAAPRLERFRLTAARAGELEVPLEAAGRGLSRRALDRMLADHAVESGATLRENTRVLDWRRGREAFELTLAGAGEAVRARLLVNATGRNGPGATSGRRRAERGLFVGFQRHHRALEGLPAAMAGRVEIHALPGGYVGLAEIETGEVNLCALVRSSDLRRAGSVELLLARAGDHNPALGERLARLSPSGERWLTTAGLRLRRPGPGGGPAFDIGDAAGMIAPVCGDGLGMALRSAELAAEEVPAALDGTPGRALQRHRSRWAAEFGPRLRLGRLVQAGLMKPWVAPVLVAAGRGLPAAVRWLVRGTRDWPRAEAGARSATP